MDANGDGDAADAGDTPGLPFCTLSSLTFSGDVTLNPVFTSSTTTYTASAAHDVEITTVTASLNNPSNTVSIMKGTDTPTTSVPLDVGSNVITIEVTRPDDPLTPHTYTVTVTRAHPTPRRPSTRVRPRRAAWTRTPPRARTSATQSRPPTPR